MQTVDENNHVLHVRHANAVNYRLLLLFFSFEREKVSSVYARGCLSPSSLQSGGGSFLSAPCKDTCLSV